MARGGFRPGAGRPKGSGKAPLAPVITPTVTASVPVPADIAEAAAEVGLTPLAYLTQVMRDRNAEVLRRDRAAALLLPFVHPKAGDSGKKTTAAEAARFAATGKYAPGEPPKLAVMGKKAAAQEAAATAEAGTDWEELLNPARAQSCARRGKT
jgi:hypothetical protein